MADDPVSDKVVVSDILPLPGAHVTVQEIAINLDNVKPLIVSCRLLSNCQLEVQWNIELYM